MTGERPPRAPRRGVARLVVGLAVAAVLAGLDQLTKELAEAWLVPGEYVAWLGPHVGWELVYNPGGAFGLPAPSWVFLVVTVLVVVLVVVSLPRSPSWIAVVAYGMLLAGAVGNALDRLFRDGDPDGGFGSGHVVDFVAWGAFPRFNVADAAITVGFVLLATALLLDERRHRSEVGDPSHDGCRAGPDDAA